MQLQVKQHSMPQRRHIETSRNQNRSPIKGNKDSDEEVVNLVRKLTRGINKYKGKLPLKCFNCGRIGHFVSKCPYAKHSNSDEEDETPKKNKNKKGTRNKAKRKCLREASTLRKIVLHLMVIVIVTMI